MQAIKALQKTAKWIKVRLKNEGWVKEGAVSALEMMRQYLYLGVCPHTLQCGNNLFPQTRPPRLKENRPRKPPTPKGGLSAWGLTFLTTQRRLAWRQWWCLNLHADPESVRIPQPSYAQSEQGCTAACAGGLNEHVRPPLILSMKYQHS